MEIENSCYPPVDSAHPWLMVSQGNELENHTFYSISKNQYFERSIPKFWHKQVAPTSYGWLALFDLNSSPMACSLYNTASQEEIQLPSIKKIDHESRRSREFKCILSKPPSDPNCHVLLISVIHEFVFFCRLGDDKFIKRKNRFKQFNKGYISHATNFKDKIYTYMWHGGIIEIDFVGRKLVLKQLVRIQLPFVCRSVKNLVESCGELLLVEMIWHTWSEKVDYFRIYRVDLAEGKLEELRSIGDQTIFLCHHVGMSSAVGTSSAAIGGLNKNSIYYLWYDENVYVYDIAYRSKSMVKPCPIDDDDSFMMSWIML